MAALVTRLVHHQGRHLSSGSPPSMKPELTLSTVEPDRTGLADTTQ